MRTGFKILWCLIGVGLIFLGGYALFHPILAQKSLLILLAIASGIFGMFSIINYFFHKKQEVGRGWQFFDGIMSVILSILLLFTPFLNFMMAFVPIFFSVWIIFKGISLFSSAFDIKRIGGNFWYGFAFWGILCMILGIILAMNPFISTFIISSVIGISLIFYGVISLIELYYWEKISNEFK